MTNETKAKLEDVILGKIKEMMESFNATACELGDAIYEDETMFNALWLFYAPPTCTKTQFASILSGAFARLNTETEESTDSDPQDDDDEIEGIILLKDNVNRIVIAKFMYEDKPVYVLLRQPDDDDEITGEQMLSCHEKYSEAFIAYLEIVQKIVDLV